MSNLKKNTRKIFEIIAIGSCIKIENSNKTFQVLGINQRKSICWIRELPLRYDYKKTFSLSINKISLPIVCPNNRYI